ncbi:hypothetical protein BsIDN1_32080 [Bacillus safensis]|uniref:Uncharacterized protein n=1 Tax=Bacillus safensis TaxID=561879 RepID=A0A5S9M7Q0_BACIA|nr:hypothetical protein BsIDN1_32080 [Bacillus safensis]
MVDFFFRFEHLYVVFEKKHSILYIVNNEMINNTKKLGRDGIDSNRI